MNVPLLCSISCRAILQNHLGHESITRVMQARMPGMKLNIQLSSHACSSSSLHHTQFLTKPSNRSSDTTSRGPSTSIPVSHGSTQKRAVPASASADTHVRHRRFPGNQAMQLNPVHSIQVPPFAFLRNPFAGYSRKEAGPFRGMGKT